MLTPLVSRTCKDITRVSLSPPPRALARADALRKLLAVAPLSPLMGCSMSHCLARVITPSTQTSPRFFPRALFNLLTSEICTCTERIFRKSALWTSTDTAVVPAPHLTIFYAFPCLEKSDLVLEPRVEYVEYVARIANELETWLLPQNMQRKNNKAAVGWIRARCELLCFY